MITIGVISIILWLVVFELIILVFVALRNNLIIVEFM